VPGRPPPGRPARGSNGMNAAFMQFKEAAEKVWRVPACLPALRSI
jgi:hypothetical protein